MDVDSAVSRAASPRPPTSDPVPEVELYLRLLILHHLLTSSTTYPQAKELAQETVATIQRWNRRSADPIAAKVWYAVERAYELSGQLAEARPYVSTALVRNSTAHTIPFRQHVSCCTKDCIFEARR
jgi:26S proteasome regulatory subunit N3